MIFGLDTAFAIYSLTSGAEAAAAEVHQDYDRPSYVALESAWKALEAAGIEKNEVEVLAVIDFTKPSYLKRMELYRRDQCRAERYLCAHGKNSGEVFAVDFSNRTGSLQTSLGLFRVGESYRGSFGKSLKLHGLEPGKNDKAYARKIVFHSAWYVAPEIVNQNILEGLGSRLGKSLGCPAVETGELERVCSHLQPGTYLYIYGKQGLGTKKAN